MFRSSRSHRRTMLEKLEPRVVLTGTAIISEFMASNSESLLDGDGNSSDWIEIHNPGDSAVDLSGWHLSDNESDLAKWPLPNVFLSAGQYLVVFASGQSTVDYVDPSGAPHANFRLRADGEYLSISDADGTVVQDFSPAFPPQSQDVSFGLDTRGEQVYFTDPTPGAANSQGQSTSSAIVISEIMYHPASNLDAEEFIELHNTTGSAVNVRDWSFDAGVRFDFPDTNIPAGGYLVVAASLPAFAAKYPGVENVVGGWNGVLANGGEEIVLRDADGLLVDAVTYADEGRWSERVRGPLDFGHEGWDWSELHDGGGRSLELVNAAVTNDYGQNWSASLVEEGTPGNANSVLDVDGNSAPLILDAKHSPAIPKSNEAVTISARLVDESLESVVANVRYRLDGTVEFLSAPLRDDGTIVDRVAGDGVYSGILPPQADLAIVEWYVEAFDSLSNAATWPPPSQPSNLQETNLLYQVDDSFDLAAAEASGLPNYRLIFTEVERAEIQQIGSNFFEGNSSAEMNATFIAISNGTVDVRYNVGVRNRGRGSRARLPNGYRVNIPSDNKWQGLDAFNLNAQHTHLQRLGIAAYGAVGLVTEDTQPVFMTVNGVNLSSEGSPSYGVYLQVEAPGSEFAENHFPEDSDGNLYRVTREGGDRRGEFMDLGDDFSLYTDNYEKKTNEGLNDYSDILNLVDALNAEDDDYIARLKTVLDIDQWLGYLATTAILASRETALGTGHGDDFFLYRGEKDPRFIVIPHDLDAILGTGESSNVPTDSIYLTTRIAVMERFLTHPEIAPLYHAKLRDLLDTTFSKSQFDALVESTIGDRVPVEVSMPLIEFMDQRRAFILGELNSPVTVQVDLPTVNGFRTTSESSVALTGTASLVDSRSVTVNGEAVSFDPFTGVWSVGEMNSQSETLVSQGQTWQYLDAGRVPQTAANSDWRVDDPMWTDSGPAPLGYGDGDIVTETQFVDLEPFTTGTQRNITTYFRHAFEATNVDEFESLTLQLRRDDGAVVYLNGQEVVRDNLPQGQLTSETTALSSVTDSDEERFFEFSVDAGLLVEGENVLAVVIHQARPASSDTAFDLELVANTGLPRVSNGHALEPGLNPLRIEVFDGLGGSGNLIDSTTIDIWRETDSFTNVGGTIAEDTVFTLANSPYVVTDDLDVSANLMIEPGVVVLFNPNTGLVIRDAGRVIANGTPENRIRLSHNPDVSGAAWNGISIQDSDSDNQFSFIDMQNGDAQGEAVYINRGRAVFDNARWFDIDNQVLDLVHPNLIVRNSDIPSVGGDETIHLVGLDEGEQLVFDNNVIGKNTSGDDVVDIAPDSLSRQTVYFLNNVFMGGLDDGVDTDGMRVVFENNVFMDFHLGTGRTTTSNAISTGSQNVGGTRLSSDLVINNNTFYDVDHSLLLKDFSYANFTNNTVVKATVAGIQFQELNGSGVVGPGLGADIDGNIFWETPVILEAIHPDTQLSIRRSIVTEGLVDSGFGNIAADPLFVDADRLDFRLQETSPARGAGPFGTDIGNEQFVVRHPADASNLHVTELHYNPLPAEADSFEVPANGDQFEFIELWNSDNSPIDLSGVSFSEGISFVFPAQTILEPGERLVVAKNPGVFASRYGEGLRVVGGYTGQLADGGERVAIVSASGSQIADFIYGDDDVPGWPDTADGDGASLVVANLTGDYSRGSTWQASTTLGGTPALQDRGPYVASSEFDHERFEVSLRFSEAIDSTCLSTDKFVFFNETTGAALSADQVTTRVVAADEVVFELQPTVSEQDGDWRLQLGPGAIVSAAGTASVTNYEFNFFALAGDYNRDRIVDAADFTIFRDTFGSTEDLRANGAREGESERVIDFADFLVFSNNFGNRLV